jgi:flagellar biosynthesis GTPase FlhF
MPCLSPIQFGGLTRSLEASMQVFLEASARIAAALTSDVGSETSSTAQMSVRASKVGMTPEQRLGLGAPPRKQMQQEEVLAPLDEDERSAVRQRFAARGTGAYATSRGGGGGAFGSSSSCYSGRDAPSGSLSPAKQRLAAATARREAEVRTAREREGQVRQRARMMAALTARRTAEREAAEAARREEARKAFAEKMREQEERKRQVADQQRQMAIPGFGSTIARAMPPPLTEKQILRKKRQARPEWGCGHAGGYKLKAEPRRYHYV